MTARDRLALAEQEGILYSRQSETWLRDKWAQVCHRDRIPIVHIISGPRPDRGSVRINGCTAGAILGDAGQAIARAIATEHGGCIRRLDEQVIDVTSISPVGAFLLVRRIQPPELWFVEVR